MTPPTTEEIADTLGIPAPELVQYLGYEKPITAAELVEFAGANPEHEPAVRAWLGGPEPARSNGENTDAAAPTAADVAKRLGVDRRRLLQFVDFHPNPTPRYILGWASADPDAEPVVAAWLGSYTRPSAGAIDEEEDDLDVDDERRGVLVR